MTEPIQVIPMGEPELPPETVTERKLEEIIQGSRVIHARHQGFTKAMARKLLAVMDENAKLREALELVKSGIPQLVFASPSSRNVAELIYGSVCKTLKEAQ
jgi:hypothetical protein